MLHQDLPPAQIQQALAAAVGSPEFSSSPRIIQFLRFLVEQTLAGDADKLKETVIGVGVFGREPGYDPKLDPVVRVEARRLRQKLQEYYLGSGRNEPIRIELPKGGYRPLFVVSIPSAEAPTPAIQQPAAKIPRWGIAVVAILGLSLAGTILLRKPPAGIASTPRQFTAREGNSRSPSFSPDGDSLVFSRDDDTSHLYIQAVSSERPAQFTSGNVFDFEPSWSPNGSTVAFLRERGTDRYSVLLKPVAGGAERELTEVSVRSTLSWTPDGKFLAAADSDSAAAATAIVLIATMDGRKQQLTKPPHGIAGDYQPRVAPDGLEVAFVRRMESGVQDVWLSKISDGSSRQLTHESRSVEGLTWDADGRTLLAAMQRASEVRSLWRIPRSGGEMTRVAEAGINPAAPAISLQKNRLAYVVRFIDTNVWRAELTQPANPQPLTSTIELDTSPQVSPDGRRIAIRSVRSGSNEVWIMDANGRNARKLTSMNGPTTGSGRWSPDGKWIAFDSRPNGNGEILLISSAGGTPKPMTKDPANDVVPSWSRDGKTLYFASDRTGSWEVWKMPSQGGAAVRVTYKGGFSPFESWDGQYVYYCKRSAGGGIWRVPVSGGPEQQIVGELAPNLWGQWAVGASGIYYAVAPSPEKRRIRRVDLTGSNPMDLLPLTRMPVQYDSGMSISPDERWITWAQIDMSGSDIYVVDRFR